MSIIQGTSKSSAAGFSIDQSIRFNDDDSAYLTKTFASDGNRRTWTFSTWVKFANIKADNVLFSSWISSGASAYQLIYIDGADKLRLEDQSNNRLITNQVFRDVGAWYHVVARVDTTDATSSDRFQLYINGDRVTSFSTETQPSLNFEGNINKGSQPHYLGRNGYSLAMLYSDLYQAETHFIDGTALDPTSFGETNADTGQWVPIAYTGSYGTNGFYITGADSSDLGADDSGNGNDFTSSGLAAADQVSDSPTDNFWTLNPLDSNSTLANGNLQNKGGGSTNTHAPAFPTTGKWYVEIDCIDINTGTAGAHFFGICDASVNYNQNFTDHAAISAGQQRGGQLQKNNSNTTTGTAVNDGDTIALAFDADNLTLDLYVNNVQSGSQITGLTDVQYKLWIQDGASVTNMQVNFGQTGGFTYTPPTGFNALSTANLDAPTIADPSAYFQTTLYTGNASTQEVNQSGNSNFEPGFVWIKTRSNAASHALFDQVRGVNKQLRSDSSGAEYTAYSDLLTSFDADGFTLGADATVNNVNVNTYTYAAWQWAADGTSGSSNTDGDITSTVSANTTSGFSIVTYSGSGTSGDTVGHGLGVKPSVVIVKPRNAADNWIVNDWSGDYANKLKLNSTEAASSASSFVNAASSSTFTLGGDVNVNGSSRTYVAYCFAEVEGFSKFGSYTGNGSSDGVFVHTGFEVGFLMYKRTNAAESWEMYDNTRGFNVHKFNLRANLSNAEQSDIRVDLLSNGFKARSSNTAINTSGSTYIYMAFASSPFKTATAQ